jgi:hypothetical protein
VFTGLASTRDESKDQDQSDCPHTYERSRRENLVLCVAALVDEFGPWGKVCRGGLPATSDTQARPEWRGM